MSTSDRTEAASVEYKNPPVSELVLAVDFEAVGFSTVHFGQYWSIIASDFPEHPQEQAPLPRLDSQGKAVGIGVFQVPPLRRVWFESGDKAAIIQLQDGKWLYNWRKVAEASQYPRFRTIYPKFKDRREQFLNWLTADVDAKAHLTGLELTYFNRVSYDQVKQSKSRQILKAGSYLRTPLLGNPKNGVLQLTYEIPEGAGQLLVTMAPQTDVDTGENFTALELRSRSLGMPADAEKWFDTAHSTIINTFRDLTDDAIQTEVWGRA